MVEFWIFGAYCLGTVFGIIVGVKIGYKYGSLKLLTALMDGGYVIYTISADGNIHIKKPGE